MGLFAAIFGRLLGKRCRFLGAELSTDGEQLWV